MPTRDRQPFVEGANRALGDNLTRNTPGIVASYGLIGAILFFGAAGYFLDRVLGTEPWLLVAGALVGALLGLVGVYWQVRRRT
jgi:F0F1-type ATP synthase assembly protein I